MLFSCGMVLTQICVVSVFRTCICIAKVEAIDLARSSDALSKFAESHCCVFYDIILMNALF